MVMVKPNNLTKASYSHLGKLNRKNLQNKKVLSLRWKVSVFSAAWTFSGKLPWVQPLSKHALQTSGTFSVLGGPTLWQNARLPSEIRVSVWSAEDLLCMSELCRRESDERAGIT